MGVWEPDMVAAARAAGRPVVVACYGGAGRAIEAAATRAGFPFAGVASGGLARWLAAGGRHPGGDLERFRLVDAPPGAPLGQEALSLAIQAAHLAAAWDGDVRPPQAYVAHARLGSHSEGRAAKKGYVGGPDAIAVLHLEITDAVLAGALIGEQLRARPHLIALVVTTHIDGAEGISGHWSRLPAFARDALAGAVARRRT